MSVILANMIAYHKPSTIPSIATFVEHRFVCQNNRNENSFPYSESHFFHRSLCEKQDTQRNFFK